MTTNPATAPLQGPAGEPAADLCGWFLFEYERSR
ncbi:hypothetical protein FHR36_006186 [Kitasatospora paracochleata]|uniref:Uncharacterized protein n=1 Tax=Kitasatospora paracochleata TaxID=58354 RepID=A0ABT1J6E3_9ACTN|nr:hypothetical protein [Kitasatospora paracochleata]